MAIDMLRSCLQSPDQPGSGSSSAERIAPNDAARAGHPPDETLDVAEMCSLGGGDHGADHGDTAIYCRRLMQFCDTRSATSFIARKKEWIASSLRASQ